jgi:hypothetical protein
MQRIRTNGRAMLFGATAVIATLVLPQQGSAAAIWLDESACPALVGLTIDPARIGLPIRAVKVASAVMVPSAPAGSGPQGQPMPEIPAYCKVLGAMAPIDPAAPSVNFEVNLPAAWNGKAVQYGGGGLNGVLISGLDPLRDAPPNIPTPLGQGYVTLGTDSGHQASALSEIHAFGLNEEALANYAYAAYKKVHDVAAVVVQAAYGQSTSRFYYFGGSEGGREALMMAQRFPQDYDGIVSVVPAADIVGLTMKQTHLGVLQQNGAWPSPKKLATLQKAVLAACDELDGLNDGVVSNIQACSKVFDPKALRCEGGQNTSDACLSDAEIAVIDAIHAPYEYGFALANGIKSYPSFGYGGETQPGGMITQITGVKPPAFPPLSQAEQGGYGFLATAWFVTSLLGMPSSTHRNSNQKPSPPGYVSFRNY